MAIMIFMQVFVTYKLYHPKISNFDEIVVRMPGERKEKSWRQINDLEE
jgi:hypothetical protein